jgi:phospholipid transport system substrate-binding protein
MKKILISTTFMALNLLGVNSIYATTPTSSATVVTTNPVTTTKKVSSATVVDEGSNTQSVTIATGVACGLGTACMVVSDTTNKAIELINKDAANQMTNVVTSQFDFTLMTKFAMGNNWKLATPEQQAKLVSLFKQLLVYTYSTALSKFKGAKTNIVSATVSTLDPKKPDLQKSSVVSQVILANSSNNTPIKVEYDLANSTGSWKAYDIKIENASLVTTYRTQFNEVVQNSKVTGLIKQLQDKIDSLQKTKSTSIE